MVKKDIEERALNFSIRIVNLCKILRENGGTGYDLSQQLSSHRFLPYYKKSHVWRNFNRECAIPKERVSRGIRSRKIVLKLRRAC